MSAAQPWDRVSDCVFRDGNWSLVKDLALTYEPKHNGVRSYWTTTNQLSIVHNCYGEEWMLKAGTAAIENGRCAHCHVVIPKKLIGLQTLANWER
jgi:hypothetical protein